MTKIAKNVNWTTPGGTEIAVEIAVEKVAYNETTYSDGYDMGSETKIGNSKKIIVIANGQMVAMSSCNPSILAPKNAVNGMYARIGKVGLTEDVKEAKEILE